MTEVKILIVDDNPGDVRLIQEAFRGANWPSQIITAPDGTAALDYLYQRESHAGAPRPDLILLDINLPKINGLEILRTIKSDSELMKIPVVIFSSSTADKDVMRSYNLHANGYIAKPHDVDGFKTMVGVK